jgi:2'-5' RNA ligase
MISAKRYFFALFPDEKVREQLQKAMPTVLQNVSGRILNPLDWHITLVFVGNVAQNQEQHLLLADKTFTVEPFEIELTKVAYWPRAQVIWLGLNEKSDPLIHLVSSLATSLKGHGFKQDERPFEAHMTLVRNATKPSIIEKIEPIRWQVNEFALAYSMPPAPDGIRYTVRNRWSLTSSL